MGNCAGGKSGKKDPKVLTEEEIKLLLANTRLNRSQIQALHNNFLNECPTGKLTKKDFVKLFKEVHPSENKKEKADKFCEYVFKVIDKENLGYISFQDFVLCFSLTSDGDFKQKCEFAFKLYDLDKDGKISKKEMTQVLTALYDLSGISDRKGSKAPAKKVDDIIRKISAEYPQEPEPETPKEAAARKAKEAKEAKAREKAEEKERARLEKERKAAEKAVKSGKPYKPKPVKEAKPAKPAKQPKQKLPAYITKEQFIDACSSDEQLKRLFVDSIFSNSNELALAEAANINLASTSSPVSVAFNAGKISATVPSISVKSSTQVPGSNGPVGSTNTTTVDLNREPITVSTRTVTVSNAENDNKTTNNRNSDSDNNNNNITKEVVEEESTTTSPDGTVTHVSTKTVEIRSAAIAD